MFEHELSVEELATHEAIELPEREMMQTLSLLSPQINVAVPVNVGLAANVLTIDSEANAFAGQIVGQVNQQGS